MFRVWEREIPKPDFAIHHAAKVGAWPSETSQQMLEDVGSVFDLSLYTRIQTFGNATKSWDLR